MEKYKKDMLQLRRRISEIIEVGTAGDWVSKGYDLFSVVVIVVNIAVTVLYTFNSMEQKYGELLLMLESVTVFFCC